MYREDFRAYGGSGAGHASGGDAENARLRGKADLLDTKGHAVRREGRRAVRKRQRVQRRILFWALVCLLLSILTGKGIHTLGRALDRLDRSYDGPVAAGEAHFTEEEFQAEFPLLLQSDSRWAEKAYGDSTIAVSGCAPTCLSMAVLTLTRQEVTPADVAAYSEGEGFYVPGAGTKWELMTAGGKHYGLAARELSLDQKVMENCLRQGGVIVCAVREGDFTTEGHFIEIYGYQREGFLVNDPNSRERSGKLWTYDCLEPQIRNLWGFWKEE